MNPEYIVGIPTSMLKTNVMFKILSILRNQKIHKVGRSESNKTFIKYSQ